MNSSDGRNMRAEPSADILPPIANIGGSPKPRVVRELSANLALARMVDELWARTCRQILEDAERIAKATERLLRD